jgi:hypothetical protein
MRGTGAPVHRKRMVTSASPRSLRACVLGAVLAAGLGVMFVVLLAIYTLAVVFAFVGIPSSEVAIALAFDLTITATAATWWLGVKRGGLSPRAPFVVFGIGALTARLLLSADASRLAFGAGIALELMVLALVAVRARRLIRRLRQGADLPLIIRLADALEDIGVPRPVARLLTTEISTLPLALTGWFRRGPRRGFSVHRTHLSLAMHVVLIGLVAVETIVLHLLIASATPIGAWISTGLSIYAVLWLIGDAHALRLGRVRIERDVVVIEIARRWAAVVPRHAIVAVRRETALPPDAVNLAIETPTVVIELSAPITARGPFGLTRTGARLALTIDDPEDFLAALERQA